MFLEIDCQFLPHPGCNRAVIVFTKGVDIENALESMEMHEDLSDAFSCLPVVPRCMAAVAVAATPPPGGGLTQDQSTVVNRHRAQTKVRFGPFRLDLLHGYNTCWLQPEIFEKRRGRKNRERKRSGRSASGWRVGGLLQCIWPWWCLTSSTGQLSEASPP